MPPTLQHPSLRLTRAAAVLDSRITNFLLLDCYESMGDMKAVEMLESRREGMSSRGTARVIRQHAVKMAVVTPSALASTAGALLATITNK